MKYRVPVDTKDSIRSRSMTAMVVWLAVMGVLCATLHLSAAIELSRLYEHMDGTRYKRSGKFSRIITHSHATKHYSPSIKCLCVYTG